MGAEMQDPSYLAYMRALGFDDSQATAETALASTKAKAQMDLYRPEIAYQGELDRRDIGLAHEDRGMFRSGQHMQALAEQEHGQALETGRMDLEGAESVEELQRRLMDQLSGSQRKLGDQRLLADSRQYLEGGLAPYRG
jgi:hypothetical protein